MSRWELYARGVLYVSLQTLFVAVVAAFNLPGAFIIGSAISYLWTGNVVAQHGLGRVDRLIYAVGAGSGSVLGLVAGGWFAWLCLWVLSLF